MDENKCIKCKENEKDPDNDNFCTKCLIDYFKNIKGSPWF